MGDVRSVRFSSRGKEARSDILCASSLIGEHWLHGYYDLSKSAFAFAQVNEGKVLAVGPGRRTKDGELIAPGVKEGDKVLLPEYGGSQVKLGDKE